MIFGCLWIRTYPKESKLFLFWLLVWIQLKNISQIGSFPQMEVKLKIIRNHQVEKHVDIPEV